MKLNKIPSLNITKLTKTNLFEKIFDKFTTTLRKLMFRKRSYNNIHKLPELSKLNISSFCCLKTILSKSAYIFEKPVILSQCFEKRISLKPNTKQIDKLRKQFKKLYTRSKLHNYVVRLQKPYCSDKFYGVSININPKVELLQRNIRDFLARIPKHIENENLEYEQNEPNRQEDIKYNHKPLVNSYVEFKKSIRLCYKKLINVQKAVKSHIRQSSNNKSMAKPISIIDTEAERSEAELPVFKINKIQSIAYYNKITLVDKVVTSVEKIKSLLRKFITWKRQALLKKRLTKFKIQKSIRKKICDNLFDSSAFLIQQRFKKYLRTQKINSKQFKKNSIPIKTILTNFYKKYDKNENKKRLRNCFNNLKKKVFGEIKLKSSFESAISFNKKTIQFYPSLYINRIQKLFKSYLSKKIKKTKKKFSHSLFDKLKQRKKNLSIDNKEVNI